MSNIIGEPIEEFVSKQIDHRQKIYGSGYNSNSIDRSPKVLNYLNNRNAWIKLASGVSIASNPTDPNASSEELASYLGGQQRLKDLQKFSTSNYLTESDIASLGGSNLAKKYILFNGTQELKVKDMPDEYSTSYKARSGVRQTNSWSNSQTKLYGGMGSNERGLQPTPGIIDINVETQNRGSIKKATVKIKAYNKFQFGIIEILYLRLGYMMMLEYGWDKYVESISSTGAPEIKNIGGTVIENDWFRSSRSLSQSDILNKIADYQNKYKGNYNGFFGKVSNFTWKLNKDNTYDISINLLSLGSVIESLKVNIPSSISIKEKSESAVEFASFLNQNAGTEGVFNIEANTEEGEPRFNAESVGTALGSDKITNYLVRSMYRFFNYGGTGGYASNNLKAVRYFSDANEFNKATTKTQVPFKYKFTIRFGVFLDFLKKEIIGNVLNGQTYSPRLDIMTGEDETVVNYILNTVSLDPKICIFTPLMGDLKVNGATVFDSNPLPLNRSKYSQYKGIDTMKKFAVKSQVNDILYGKLMNVYLNFNFIFDTLKSNIDKENNLDLFKFLEGLCDGINKCMGNSVQIAPAIKNENIIYFADENPIPGWEKHSGTSEIQSTKINLFGYNPDGTSNFVKDFDFQTKITPKLMNQISIGATSAGGYKNATDSVGYQWWNRGLVNRFEQTYEVSEEKDDRSEDDKNWEYFKSNAVRQTGFNRFGYKINYDGYSKTWYRNYPDNIEGPDNNEVRRKNNDADNFAKGKVLKELVLDWMAGTKALINATATNRGNPNEIAIKNYSIYLAKTFGFYPSKTKTNNYGDLKNVSVPNAPYFLCDSENVSAGRNAYKGYMNAYSSILYESLGVNTGTTGFIPVNLSLTCDGLSGIKIYNRLDVSQRELPASYPESLKFVITGISDSIKNNVWETQLDTLAQPPTEKSPERIYDVTIPTTATGTDSTNETTGNYTFTGPESQKVSLIKKINLESSIVPPRADGVGAGIIYLPQVTNKTQVVLHHTADNGSIKQVINYWKTRDDHVATHFIITRDGDYDQLFPLEYWANHTGRGATRSKRSIGIELSNFGYFDGKDTRTRNGESQSYYYRKDRETGRQKTIKLIDDIKPTIYPDSLRAYNNVGFGLMSSPDNWYTPGFSNRSKAWRIGIPMTTQFKRKSRFQAYTQAQMVTLIKILKQIQEKYPNIPIFLDPGDVEGQKKQWKEMFPDYGTGGKLSQNALNGVPGLYTHNSFKSTKSDMFPQSILYQYLYKKDPMNLSSQFAPNQYLYIDSRNKNNIISGYRGNSEEEVKERFPKIII